MRKVILTVLGIFWIFVASFAQAGGYKVGDTAQDFRLQNVDGTWVSLSSMENAKGAILIFSCNTCPYVVAYEDRMIALHEKYAPLGYPLIAINANDARLSPGDSFEKMQERASAKKFPFVYLHDKYQDVIQTYGGTRTPHVYLLQKEGDAFIVRYMGAIDNNYQSPDAVSERYVEAAIADLSQGKKVAVESTKAIGCSVKWSKKSR